MLRVPASGRVPVHFVHIVIEIFNQGQRNIRDSELGLKLLQDVKGRHIDSYRFGIQALFPLSFNKVEVIIIEGAVFGF